jgi:hypothetical protein
VNARITGWSSVGYNALILVVVSRGMFLVLTLHYKKFLFSCFWFKRLSSVEEFPGGG